MKECRGLQRNKVTRSVVLAAGFFDGIHRGHRKVIDHAVAAAAQQNAEAWALTFDPHPLKVLCPEKAPKLLASRRHRLKLMAWAGLDGCLSVSFTRQLAALTPEAFLKKLCRALPDLRQVVVGRDWRFGQKGTGDLACLRSQGRSLGFTVEAVRPAMHRKQVISSTRIRECVTRGDLDEARRMLGRAFSVLGGVIRGRTIGRRLGYPTANIHYENEVLPPGGVYAVYAAIPGAKQGRLHEGVLNLGFRPTYGRRPAEKPLLELHILDLNRDLYGKDVEVFFVRRIRRERPFASEAALAKQIGKDVEQAGEILKKKTKDSLYRYCTPVL